MIYSLSKLIRKVLLYMRSIDFKYMNLKKAYVNNLISDDKVRINLLEDRNSTSHIYNENLADEVANRIVKYYVGAIGELVDNLGKLL